MGPVRGEDNLSHGLLHRHPLPQHLLQPGPGDSDDHHRRGVPGFDRVRGPGTDNRWRGRGQGRPQEDHDSGHVLEGHDIRGHQPGHLLLPTISSSSPPWWSARPSSAPSSSRRATPWSPTWSRPVQAVGGLRPAPHRSEHRLDPRALARRPVWPSGATAPSTC